MNKLLLLLKINLQAILNPSRIAKSGYDKNKKNSALSIFLVAFIAITLLASSAAYMYLIAVPLQAANMLDMLPILGVIAATAIVLFTSMYQTQSYLFSSKDMDLLMSMPVTKPTIMLSKIGTLYIENLIFSAIILIPAGAIYCYLSQCSMLFWVFFIIGFLFVPCIPLIISTLIGYILGLASTKFKSKNFVTIILSLALTVIVVVLSFNTEDLMNDIAANAKSIQDVYFTLYIPAKFFYNSFVNNSIIDLLIFIALSIAPFILFIFILSKFYLKIISQLSVSKKSSNYKHKSLKRSSAVLAIYKKEIEKYFNTPIYLLNTGIGMILLLVLAIATLFAGAGTIAQLLEIPELAEYVPQGLVALICAIISMSVVSASSISLESINIWILKSSPVDEMDIFKAKILVNLTVILPLLYLSIIIFTFAVQYTAAQIFVTILVTTAFSIYISVSGLVINLMFPKLDAVSEVQVVKQSMSTFVSMFSPMIILGILVALYLLIFAKLVAFEVFCIISAIVFIVLTLACIKFLSTKGKKIFRNL